MDGKDKVQSEASSEKKKNHEVLVLATYASLQKAAKSYLEYAIEIRPISNYAEKRRAWRISALSVSLEVGSSMVDYGLPSGKHSGLGIYYGQMLTSSLSSLISECWPNPPKMEEIKECVKRWFSEYKKDAEDLSEAHLRILARGISFLLQALFLYADAILETSVGLGHEEKEGWEKLLEMSREKLEEEVLSSLSK